MRWWNHWLFSCFVKNRESNISVLRTSAESEDVRWPTSLTIRSHTVELAACCSCWHRSLNGPQMRVINGKSISHNCGIHIQQEKASITSSKSHKPPIRGYRCRAALPVVLAATREGWDVPAQTYSFIPNSY